MFILRMGNQFDCRKENLSIGKNNRENLYLLRRRKQLKIKENGKLKVFILILRNRLGKLTLS